MWPPQSVILIGRKKTPERFGSLKFLPFLWGMETINLVSNQSVGSQTYQSYTSIEGRDGKCLYRSIITQQEKGLDINFGFLLVKQKYITSRVLLDNCCMKGWCIPYDFHTWNEDDENIYDDITSLNEHGMELPSNPKVLIVDWSNKKFNNYAHFAVNAQNLIKSLQYRKDVDMVYVCGYAEANVPGCLIDWDIINRRIENACNEIENLTGSTMNNVVI